MTTAIFICVIMVQLITVVEYIAASFVRAIYNDNLYLVASNKQ